MRIGGVSLGMSQDVPEFLAPPATTAAAAPGPGWPKITPRREMPRSLRRGFWLIDQSVREESDDRYLIALMFAAETITPTCQLVASWQQENRPGAWARLEMASREAIRDNQPLWIAVALHRRKTAIEMKLPYAPPCITCATQCELACRRCQQPLCAFCIREGWVCQGCPPAIPQAEFDRRVAEGLQIVVRQADLDAPPAHLIEGL